MQGSLDNGTSYVLVNVCRRIVGNIRLNVNI